MKIGIHIFRRDFRLYDNPSLYKLSREVDRILGVFILDEDQPTQKMLKNEHSLVFMYDALYELKESELGGRLLILRGNVNRLLRMLINEYSPYAISFNGDHSEYSKKRDAGMEKEIKSVGSVKIIRYDYEMLLNDPGEFVKSSDGRAYTVFGAYMKNVESRELGARKCYKEVPVSRFVESRLKSVELMGVSRSTRYCNREYVLSRIRSEAGDKAHSYDVTRRQLDREQLRLAAHLKFGIVSSAEVYRMLANRYGLRYKEALHWRNFYFLIRIYNYCGYGHMDDFFVRRVKWGNSSEYYSRMWKTCTTGYPIIDACVRKLKLTGWLNNRGNLLVSFFSIKILHIDPFDSKYGGQVEYSKYLVYCCYANNWCNWNFALGVLDQGAQRYTSGHNRAGRYYDVTNIAKWDPGLSTIRKYIPELDSVKDEDVYSWHRLSSGEISSLKVSYPGALVNARKQFDKYKMMTRTG